MSEKVFELLNKAEYFYWNYIGSILLVAMGLFLTVNSGFYQFRVIRYLPKIIKQIIEVSSIKSPGVSPVRLFFATAGGMIGLGNVIAVVTALLIGGPGALFWLWIVAIMGVIIKYSETYLGLKYRQIKPGGTGYEGGPMHYIPHAFKGKIGKWLCRLTALFLCVYCVEIYQFTVVSETLYHVTGIDKEWMILFLLLFTIYVGLGGVSRLSAVCSILMPIFILGYSGMCLWIIALNAVALPAVLKAVVVSAFSGHAALGGFAGATFWLALQQGTARATYSSDIAIGFDSMIQSESRAMDPQHQALVVMLAMILDSFICTMTIMLLLITGVWQAEVPLDNAQYVINALAQYFPSSVKYIFASTIFLVGVTTIQAYFVVGIKSALYLAPKWGRVIYFAYASIAFWTFAHYDSSKVMLIMSLACGGLIMINLLSIFLLRKNINFKPLRGMD